jgi:16S rRNA (guanine527-N7)-methyltransferase
MNLIRKYFPGLSDMQSAQFMKLMEVIPELNRKVNIISRQDIGHLEERHVLHCLAIAKKFTFGGNQTVIDAGTGGGFPGIPLAILFPQTRFILVDSIGKKVRLVEEICKMLELENVRVIHGRVEQLNLRADFVVSRAVAAFPVLFKWIERSLITGERDSLNGLIALKGGDLDAELGAFRERVTMYPLSRWFEEPFFSTKTIVYLKK